MSKTHRKRASRRIGKGPVAVDNVDQVDIIAALTAQALAANTRRDMVCVNRGIARKLKKGAAMAPGYRFDWAQMRVLKDAG